MIPPHVEPQSQQEQQPARAQAEARAEETRAQEAQRAPTGGPEQQTPAERHEGEGREHERRTGGKVVHLHTAHAKVPIPYVTPGDMFSNVRTATSTATSAATSLLPSPRKLAFYGILGGMTAAGAIGWPVAVAVGAATEVVTREQAARQREEHERVERERAEREQGRQSATEQTQPERPARTATA